MSCLTRRDDDVPCGMLRMSKTSNRIVIDTYEGEIISYQFWLVVFFVQFKFPFFFFFCKHNVLLMVLKIQVYKIQYILWKNYFYLRYLPPMLLFERHPTLLLLLPFHRVIRIHYYFFNTNSIFYVIKCSNERNKLKNMFYIAKIYMHLLRYTLVYDRCIIYYTSWINRKFFNSFK